MPQHKSAEKRVRQNTRRRLRNRYHRSRLRTMVKQLRLTDDPATARALFPQVQAYVDRLVTKRIIHRNKAANYKRALARRVHRLG
jgi:small subunit ribosomal protein S20